MSGYTSDEDIGGTGDSSIPYSSTLGSSSRFAKSDFECVSIFYLL